MWVQIDAWCDTVFVTIGVNFVDGIDGYVGANDYELSWMEPQTSQTIHSLCITVRTNIKHAYRHEAQSLFPKAERKSPSKKCRVSTTERGVSNSELSILDHNTHVSLHFFDKK